VSTENRAGNAACVCRVAARLSLQLLLFEKPGHVRLFFAAK